MVNAMVWCGSNSVHWILSMCDYWRMNIIMVPVYETNECDNSECECMEGNDALYVSEMMKGMQCE